MLKLLRRLFSNSPASPERSSFTSIPKPNLSASERLFRAEAKEAGLILTHSMPGTRMHCLDLNGGAVMLIDLTPERLYKLLKLARKYAKSSDSGEHKTILSLGVYENEIKRFEADKAPTYALYWERKSNLERNDLVTVEKYLTDNGFDLSDKALLG